MYILLIQRCTLKQPHWSNIAPQRRWVYAFDFDTHTKTYVCTFSSSAHPLSSKAIDHIIAIRDDKPVRHANHEGSGSAGSCKALADASFFKEKRKEEKEISTKKERRSEKSKEENHPTSTPSNPSNTSSPTPPFLITILIIFAIVALLTPPRRGLHTPGLSSSPVVDGSSKLAYSAAAVEPSVATFSALATPGCVRRDGGSTVRIERSFRRASSELVLVLSRVTETARTVSATAISSRLGSKIMLSPAEITRRVIGGRTCCDGVGPLLMVPFW